MKQAKISFKPKKEASKAMEGILGETVMVLRTFQVQFILSSLTSILIKLFTGSYIDWAVV